MSCAPSLPCILSPRLAIARTDEDPGPIVKACFVYTIRGEPFLATSERWLAAELPRGVVSAPDALVAGHAFTGRLVSLKTGQVITPACVETIFCRKAP